MPKLSMMQVTLLLNSSFFTKCQNLTQKKERRGKVTSKAKTKKVVVWCLKGREKSDRNKVVGLIKSLEKAAASQS